MASVSLIKVVRDGVPAVRTDFVEFRDEDLQIAVADSGLQVSDVESMGAVVVQVGINLGVYTED